MKIGQRKISNTANKAELPRAAPDDEGVPVVTKAAVDGEAPLDSGALHLRVAGFAAQDIVSIADIVAAIDVLPAMHLQGLREINYSPDDGFLRSQGTRPPYAEFIQRKRAIVFYELGSFDLFHHILYHEIGHFVFFLILSSTAKKHWVTMIYPSSDCATAYGTLNASEDFAETYACYVRDADSLKRFPEKLTFMRDVVFSGLPETLKETVKGRVKADAAPRRNARPLFSA
jgi:hypothetical protein